MNAGRVAPLFRIRGLAKTTASGRVLLAIDELAVARGACILLSGRNGAGKTTLLKIIAGLEPPDRARVEYEGAELSWRAARRRFRNAVVYLHQQPYLFDRSVVRNVAYGLRALGVKRAEIAQRVDQALASAGLTHLAGRNARELSGGERQRVALARALVLAPRLILLDEPLASLDEGARAYICERIAQLKARGIAVVLTSHERLSLATLTDYHYELADGAIRLLSTADGSSEATRPTVVSLDESPSRRARLDDRR